MGYIRHDAIVVTCWDEKRSNKAHEKAKEIGLIVSEIVETKLNGYYSFLIAPDGSKEGWDSSDEGEEMRRRWIEWANSEPELWVDWAYVNYGGNDPNCASLKAHNN